jgi:VWFA-related protein
MILRDHKLSHFLVFLFILTLAGARAISQEPLRYDVAVDVKVVPVFAVDAEGNPVFDLTQAELELFVNDRPVAIADFQRYTFEDIQEIEKKVKTGEKGAEAKPLKQTERVVFIIIDSIYNSHYGFRRSKKIAEDLIRSGPPGDTVILLQNTPAGGLNYIASSEKDSQDIFDKLQKMKMPHEKWNRDIFQSRAYDQFTDYGLRDEAAVSRSLKLLQNQQLEVERMRYQNQVKYFARSLVQLKYALNTITRPKIVFLISEGIAKGAFNTSLGESEPDWGKNYSVLLAPEKTVQDTAIPLNTRLFTYLMDVVKAINRGGSVLYAINPARVKHDQENMGDLSLMTLSGESGGQYFAGSDIETVVKEIRKNTAAYYELIFSLQGVAGQTMDIKVTCKRPGIKIHTLSHAEQEKAYAYMEPLKKKLFALDVVNRGNWSRIVGKVVQFKAHKTDREKTANKVLYNVTIPLPRKMQRRHLDVFILIIQLESQKVDIRLSNRKLKDKVTFKIQAKEKQQLYFVIVEPENTYCIYNRIQ